MTPADKDKNFHIVGIGASAGGLEAIELFFKAMPPQNHLAFVVVQHLSPDYKSLMSELLTRHTHMEVKPVEDGMLVEAGTVYVIPPKQNLKIFHGALLLSEQTRDQNLNLPIDIFFTSLAEDQAEKAVAIILSGTGSDGTRGIRAIKGNGGMVMCQDEESAKFDGMPASAIATGLVDFIQPPGEMPRQLLAYVKHPSLARSEYSRQIPPDMDVMTRIFALLREKSKVDFTHYKPSTVMRRIERRMALHQITDLPSYLNFMRERSQETMDLYRELLIGVTGFFRDPPVFQTFYEKYLPSVLENSAKREIRLWCAGCSSGEEAYTLAILVREFQRQSGKQIPVKIFATDVDETAINQAGMGIYPESIVADVERDLLNRYFNHYHDQFRVNRELREMVVFARHNLIKDPPFTNIDLITCRNLLIYLEPVLQQRIFAMFNFALNRGGVLMLGSSESLGEKGEYFETLDARLKLFRSKGNRKSVGFSLSSGGKLIHPDKLSGVRDFYPQAPGMMPNERLLDRLLPVLSDNYVPPALVVNEQNEIIHIIGEAGNFLRIPMGRMSTELGKMLPKELSVPLVTGLQKVFKKQEEIRYSNIHMQQGKDKLNLSLRFRSLPGGRLQEKLAAVFFEEVRSQAASKETENKEFDVSAEAQQRILDLEQELQLARENLQATVEELETSNEELQSSNEELLSSNEELQSTNEELQSVNEELHTVNAEHQSKIIELTELTNDLDNLLAATRIATLFLDEDLGIRRFTPQTQGLFNILDKDVGRPFEHLAHGILHADPIAVARNVLKTAIKEEHEVQSGEGHWYLMQVLPYALSKEKTAGVVISFVDIHEAKHHEEMLRRNIRHYPPFLKFARTGWWEWDIAGGKLEWSAEAEKLFGLHPGELKNAPNAYQKFLDCVHPDDRDKVAELMDQALQSEGEFRTEYRVLWPENSPYPKPAQEVWLEAVGEVIGRKKDNNLFFNGLVRYISGEKEAIASLNRQTDILYQSGKRERFRDWFANSPSGMALVAPNGCWLEVNPAFCALMGYGVGDLPAAALQNATRVQDQESDLAYMADLLSGKVAAYSANTHYLKKDGQTFLALSSVAPICDEQGTVMHLVLQIQAMKQHETKASL